MATLFDDTSFLQALRKNRWIGSVARGGLPRVPQMVALPTASADYEGRLVYLPGTTDGHVYVCIQVASTWTWQQLDNA